MLVIPPFLAGQRIYLRDVAESDLEGDYLTWLNDAEVCQGNRHHVFPYSRDQALAYIARARDSRTDLILAIVKQDGNCHIGNIALQSIHATDRSAEFAILIGEKSAWGQGYAFEAAQLICGHGFDALNLHRIHCGTFANNHAMMRLAQKLGMREEGRRREAAFKNGSYVDVIEFGMLHTEFRR